MRASAHRPQLPSPYDDAPPESLADARTGLLKVLRRYARPAPIRDANSFPRRYNTPDMMGSPTFDRISQADDWDDLTTAVEQYLMTYGLTPSRVKEQLLAFLGRVGSERALESIRRYEAWTWNVRRHPPPFRLGTEDAPESHMGPSPYGPAVRRLREDGREAAIVRVRRIRQGHYWLTNSADGVDWAPLVLLDIPGLPEPPEPRFDVVESGGVAVLRADGVEIARFDLESVMADEDKDGLTDAYERRLGTDPGSADSDGDGTPDGADGNPLTVPLTETDEVAQIRQAAFFSAFGTRHAYGPIFLPQGQAFARQEYRGHAGFVLPTEDPPRWVTIITYFEVEILSATRAMAYLVDGGGGSMYYLRKHAGTWVVTLSGQVFVT